MPSVLGDEETKARLAEVARHDRLKAQLDKGHALRLLAAAPIVVWTLALMAVVILAVVVPLLQLVFGAVGDFTLDWWVAGVVVVAVLAETAAVWSATILIRDTVRPASWRTILVLAAVALGISLVMLLAGGDAEGIQWLALAAMAYVLLVAVAQLVRARRLAPMVDEVERWYP